MDLWWVDLLVLKLVVTLKVYLLGLTLVVMSLDFLYLVIVLVFEMVGWLVLVLEMEWGYH